MASLNMLYEMFDIYLREAREASNKKDYASARKYYMNAAMKMFEIAKQTTGEEQKAQYLRAKSLVETAESLSDTGGNPQGNKNNSAEVEQFNVSEPKNKSIEEALEELNSLIGLGAVKAQVSEWVKQVKGFAIRAQRGYKNETMSYHLVFTGNPGTGKTTVARIITEIYHALGIISKGQLVEVSRADLVAGYVGQTAIKTKNAIQEARGGVLFIDEAYTLSPGDRGGNDFGKEAIDTLLKEMEDNRSDLVVIAAGYRELMDNFIAINPGLESRFKTFIDFADYSADELFDIFMMYCKKWKYKPTDAVKVKLRTHFESVMSEQRENFGNARYVRNIFEAIESRHAARIAELENPTDEDLETIKEEDVVLK